MRFQSAMWLLQVLQFQGMMEGHEVRVTGDPPEGHGVLSKGQTHGEDRPCSQHKALTLLLKFTQRSSPFLSIVRTAREDLNITSV